MTEKGILQLVPNSWYRGRSRRLSIMLRGQWIMCSCMIASNSWHTNCVRTVRCSRSKKYGPFQEIFQISRENSVLTTEKNGVGGRKGWRRNIPDDFLYCQSRASRCLSGWLCLKRSSPRHSFPQVSCFVDEFNELAWWWCSKRYVPPVDIFQMKRACWTGQVLAWVGLVESGLLRRVCRTGLGIVQVWPGLVWAGWGGLWPGLGWACWARLWQGLIGSD